MSHDRLEVEAYVKTADGEAILALLSRDLGVLKRENTPEWYGFQVFAHDEVRVFLTPSEDDCLCVRIQGGESWPSHVALARHLASSTNRVVRCDPGEEFPEIDPMAPIFLQIENGHETLITLP